MTAEAASFSGRYGPWAAVTGAGEGIGAAFADELARRGLSVVLVDRDEEALHKCASRLRDSDTTVHEVALDLSERDAAADLWRALDAVDLGLFVSNAAVPYVGPLLDQSLDSALVQLDVNCRVPLAVVHHLLPRLVTRGRGGIVLLSSLSAMRGAPLVAGYAATKAWNLILAESLWEEVRDLGVDVLAVLPGSTRTPGFLRSKPQAGLGTSNLMDPADVAREALDALGTVPSVIPGSANQESEALMASMDRAEAARMMGEVMRAMYPPDRQADPAV